MTMWPADELPEGYDPRERPWYKDAVAAKASTLTEPYQDAASGKLIVTVATPLLRDGSEPASLAVISTSPRLPRS